MSRRLEDTELPALCALVADVIDAQKVAEQSGDPDDEGHAIRLLNRLFGVDTAAVRADLAAVCPATKESA